MNKESILEGIRSTWDAIAYDIIAMEQDINGPSATVSQSLAIEMTLDANRIEQFGYLDQCDLDAFNSLDWEERLAIAKEALPERAWS